MPTPHNNAKPGDIAKTVLIPTFPIKLKTFQTYGLKYPAISNATQLQRGAGFRELHPTS